MFYLAKEAAMQANYGDVSFTLADGTDLKYYIQVSDAEFAKVYVKIPSLTAGGLTIYCYYSTTGATVTSSSGSNTFPFFADIKAMTQIEFDAEYTSADTAAGSIATSAGNPLVFDEYSFVYKTNPSITKLFTVMDGDAVMGNFIVSGFNSNNTLPSTDNVGIMLAASAQIGLTNYDFSTTTGATSVLVDSVPFAAVKAEVMLYNDQANDRAYGVMQPEFNPSPVDGIHPNRIDLNYALLGALENCPYPVSFNWSSQSINVYTQFGWVGVDVEPVAFAGAEETQ